MAAPATPASLAVSATASNKIVITWANVADETGFRLYRSEDDVTYVLWRTLDADVLIHSDFQLDPDTAYYYKISAFNGDGESALSTEQHDTTLASDWKYMYVHGTGPFNYDANAAYAGLSILRRAIFTDGKLYIIGRISTDDDLSIGTGKTLFMTTTGNLNFGGAVEGAWRIIRDGNNLVFQRYESSVWVTKDTITP